MHDGMQYDPIQGHGQGQEPLKVGNSVIFTGYLLPHLQRGNAYSLSGRIFVFFCPSISVT